MQTLLNSLQKESSAFLFQNCQIFPMERIKMPVALQLIHNLLPRIAQYLQLNIGAFDVQLIFLKSTTVFKQFMGLFEIKYKELPVKVKIIGNIPDHYAPLYFQYPNHIPLKTVLAHELLHTKCINLPEKLHLTPIHLTLPHESTPRDITETYWMFLIDTFKDQLVFKVTPKVLLDTFYLCKMYEFIIACSNANTRRNLLCHMIKGGEMRFKITLRFHPPLHIPFLISDLGFNDFAQTLFEKLSEVNSQFLPVAKKLRIFMQAIQAAGTYTEQTFIDAQEIIQAMFNLPTFDGTFEFSEDFTAANASLQKDFEDLPI